ncbi:hypothetical protein F8154_02890 [Alkaliphilus pronyensis]|uniref:Peptidase A2 domain-containing protein n=1 Tax=Alkaliphilus pronyensis TaxID=1482732 RepID=A0A6I0FDE5_9FIRM|nr:retropepsin-like aspartic protease [Alkaliphilus pronyensis]KAB3537257.1 hypothetical protein F8154_02890 [Alkaliphilus pronyensis]
MVKLKLKYGLPFCSIKLTYQEKVIALDNVLIDTGSGGTVLKMDKVEEIGITIEPNDTIETISGVGGSEFVYKKKVDLINLGDLSKENFKVEIWVMDYGFDINGIVGMDLLKAVGVVIDLKKMVVGEA